MSDDRWAPPDPAHRLTPGEDHRTVRRIRRSWRRRRQREQATSRGRFDTWVVVLLVVVVTIATFAMSDDSGDITRDNVDRSLQAPSPQAQP